MSASLSVAPCAYCSHLGAFNPDRVPSIRLNAEGQLDPTVPRQPICRTCWDARQTYRRDQGLPEESLLPGAYDPVPDEAYDG